MKAIGSSHFLGRMIEIERAGRRNYLQIPRGENKPPRHHGNQHRADAEKMPIKRN